MLEQNDDSGAQRMLTTIAECISQEDELLQQRRAYAYLVCALTDAKHTQRAVELADGYLEHGAGKQKAGKSLWSSSRIGSWN